MVRADGVQECLYHAVQARCALERQRGRSVFRSLYLIRVIVRSNNTVLTLAAWRSREQNPAGQRISGTLGQNCGRRCA